MRLDRLKRYEYCRINGVLRSASEPNYNQKLLYLSVAGVWLEFPADKWLNATLCGANLTQFVTINVMTLQNGLRLFRL